MRAKKVIKPDIVGKGAAIPLGKNMYYMQGPKHTEGGIDIGKNPKTGLEVEGGEVMHLTNKEAKVFSAVPILNGESPAQKVLQGETPEKVFNAQQTFKSVNGINDDGSKKELGGKDPIKGDGSIIGNAGAKVLNFLQGNKVNSAIKDFRVKGKPVAKSVIQLLDPTGVSNYPDIYDDFKNGSSTAKKVLDIAGAIPMVNKVKAFGKSIKAAEFLPKALGVEGDLINIAKDTNIIPKKTSSFKLGGTKMNRNKYELGGIPKPKKIKGNTLTPNIPAPALYTTPNNDIQPDLSLSSDPYSTGEIPNKFSQILGNVNVGLQKVGETITNYTDNNPGVVGDALGVASNTVGSLISNRANNKMLDSLKYAAQPVSRQPVKLKTNININPQLDKMRETVASYEKDIDGNTASSRVALARKQKVRSAGMLQTNELFGQKENMETDLINRDKLNQQQVADANLQDYNRWSEGKANFNNSIAEKRSENTVGLVENINAGIQDAITKGEKRNATRENMITMAASHPNVNPRLLKDLGVKSITDKMVADWDKANPKKAKKSKS